MSRLGSKSTRRWLAWPGKWGGSDSPPGPKGQGKAWADPQDFFKDALFNDECFPGTAARDDAVVSQNTSVHILDAIKSTVTTSAADNEELLLINTDATPDPVVAGSNLTYTITITNEGSTPAAPFTVLDELPVETTFVSCNAGGSGVCGGLGNSRTIEFSTLGPGDSATVILVAAVGCSVPDGTELDNTASLHSTTADPEDEEDENETLVTPVLNSAPFISRVMTSPSVLSPPNHKMVNVAVDYEVVDECAPVTVELHVSSNEPANGLGDGDTAPDWEVLGPHLVRLRAERAGGGSGRIYTIIVVATDSIGQSSSHSVIVVVPKSEKR